MLLSASRALPPKPKPRGSDMRYFALAAILFSAAALAGCSEGVLAPKGPIAAAERLLMLNSTGIMLAIVIPTVLATLGVAWWFRAANERARYRPDFAYSGRLELLVWSIPIMTILLVGGVAWLSSYDLDPPKAIASAQKPVRVQVVALDWKWLFIYPEEGIATVNQLTVPVGAEQLRADLFGRHEQLLRAAARRPDLHDVRDGDAPSSAGRPCRNLPGNVGELQRRGIFRHGLQRKCSFRRKICAVGGGNTHRR